MKTRLQKTLEQAKRECDAAGIRLTPKRTRVLAVLLSAKTALSAYQIMDDYADQYGENLQAMSAYRILDFLLSAELVHRLATTQQYIACSHIDCEQQHAVPQFLICNNCEQVVETGLDKKLIIKLQDISRKCDFHLNSQQLELHGLCRRCQPAK